MSGRVHGKVALVTGAAKGLGEADARALAAEGAHVVLTDLDSAAGMAVADDINAVFKPQDVTDETRWQEVIAEIEREFGALHVLVNNAGIVLPGSIESQTYDEFKAQTAVSLDATFLGSKSAIPLMAQSGGGSIINMASVASKLAYGQIVGYAAAKAAVEGISRSIAAHCLESGYKIRCNSIHPGSIDTPMVQNFGHQAAAAGITAHGREEAPVRAQLGVLGRAHNIADVVVFLASDESVFITAQEFVVDGGMSMLAAPLVHELQ